MSALLPFCNTDHQRQIVHLRDVESLKWAEIGVRLNCHERNAAQSYQRVRKRAAEAGVMPDHGLSESLPPGVFMERATIQQGPNGEIERTWLKAKTWREAQVCNLLEKLDAGDVPHKPFRPTKAPAKSVADYATLLTITDFHLGMYAYEAETGDDWDTGIAESVFLNAINDMCKACPKSELGILNQLGDFLHWDGLLAVTPTSKHVLDADTRYGKLVDLTMRIMTEAVRIMLKKFGRVHVVQAEGNHDETGSIWLRKFMKHMFANEPRVTVDDTEFPYYAFLHGETMLAFHHGHKLKLAQVQKLFSSDPRYRAMWGNAKQAYIHTGHLHHEKVVEDGGAIAEQHPTLSGRDAYAARGGWVSMRGAKVITYDKVDGEIHRVTVRPRA